MPQPWRRQLEPFRMLQLPAKHGVVSCLSTGAAWKIQWQGPRCVKRIQAGSFCQTYPNDLRFNMFTLRKLLICMVLRDVARSCRNSGTHGVLHSKCPPHPPHCRCYHYCYCCCHRYCCCCYYFPGLAVRGPPHLRIEMNRMI